MRFALAAFGLAAVASASISYDDKPDTPVAPYSPPANTTVPPKFTTKVVTSYTTYCPTPTEIVHGEITYTVTEATTLTITNCPCTLSVPVYTTTPTTAPVHETPVSPVLPPAPYYPSKNITTVPPAPTGTGAYTPPAGTSPIAPPGYTGAANKASFGVGAVLAAVGFIAAL